MNAPVPKEQRCYRLHYGCFWLQHWWSSFVSLWGNDFVNHKHCKKAAKPCSGKSRDHSVENNRVLALQALHKGLLSRQGLHFISNVDKHCYNTAQNLYGYKSLTKNRIIYRSQLTRSHEDERLLWGRRMWSLKWILLLDIFTKPNWEIITITKLPSWLRLNAISSSWLPCDKFCFKSLRSDSLHVQSTPSMQE